jgi:hypothetical protein
VQGHTANISILAEGRLQKMTILEAEKYRMKKILIFLLFLITLVSFSFGQAFEGTLDFKKITPNDTVKYKYYVKGNNVRIEEMNKSGAIAGIMLVDIAKNSILALSPERKMYMEVPALTKPVMTGKPEINKGSGTKLICGEMCKLWRIRSKEENTEVSYWVSDDKFDFFYPLLKTLSRKDKLSIYFMQVPQVPGVMALEATERSLLRDFKNAIVATKIEKKVLDASLFAIPAGYQKYDK